MRNSSSDGAMHLSPEALAGYLDHDLPGDERTRVELHLASCAECREELAVVRRLRPRPGRPWVPVLASAAAVAAVGALMVGLPGQAPEPSATRARPDAEAPLGVISPLPSAAIPPGPITFAWRSAGPGASYTITLQEADGRVLWTATVDDTAATPPDSIGAVERTRFWSVDALLPDGRSRSTGVVRVRTRP